MNHLNYLLLNYLLNDRFNWKFNQNENPSLRVNYKKNTDLLPSYLRELEAVYFIRCCRLFETISQKLKIVLVKPSLVMGIYSVWKRQWNVNPLFLLTRVGLKMGFHDSYKCFTGELLKGCVSLSWMHHCLVNHISSLSVLIEHVSSGLQVLSLVLLWLQKSISPGKNSP